MHNYSLYDMLGLIKLGVWQGGEVDTLGYVGRAMPCDLAVSKDVLLGIYLSYDVVILQNSEMVDGAVNLMLGLYQPYQQGYRKFSLHVDVASEQVLTKRLITLIEGGGESKPKRLIWSHNIYKKNPFRHEPKYTSDYSSLRSGRIGTTRRNR